MLGIDGPFEQKTGGKGANAAAAAGQTFACEFIGNMGDASACENASLLADLATYGAVDTGRCGLLPGLPTGTAYILLFPDNDNCIPILVRVPPRPPARRSIRFPSCRFPSLPFLSLCSRLLRFSVLLAAPLIIVIGPNCFHRAAPTRAGPRRRSWRPAPRAQT